MRKAEEKDPELEDVHHCLYSIMTKYVSRLNRQTSVTQASKPTLKMCLELLTTLRSYYQAYDLLVKMASTGALTLSIITSQLKLRLLSRSQSKLFD